MLGSSAAKAPRVFLFIKRKKKNISPYIYIVSRPTSPIRFIEFVTMLYIITQGFTSIFESRIVSFDFNKS